MAVVVVVAVEVVLVVIVVVVVAAVAVVVLEWKVQQRAKRLSHLKWKEKLLNFYDGMKEAGELIISQVFTNVINKKKCLKVSQRIQTFTTGVAILIWSHWNWAIPPRTNMNELTCIPIKAVTVIQKISTFNVGLFATTTTGTSSLVEQLWGADVAQACCFTCTWVGCKTAVCRKAVHCNS